MISIPKTPDIKEPHITPAVATLLEINQLQKELIQALRDEIAQLKGLKQKPKIKPSALEKEVSNKGDDTGTAGNSGKAGEKAVNKRPGSAKASKNIEIHKTETLRVESRPEGCRFKGYEDYRVQGLLVQPFNTLYRRERWVTPSGQTLIAPLPAEVQRLGGHFNRTLICFILCQYHQSHVTQPLILEQLREFGIDISAGQVNHIITEQHDQLHTEKDDILQAGLEVSAYVNVDDTGARHRGRNGYCTHIGNTFFAWFKSTGSKSRINFLELLRADHEDYRLDDDAIGYMRDNKLPKAALQRLTDYKEKVFEDKTRWNDALKKLNITRKRHIRIATQGALTGSILAHGFNPKLVIVSDDAGQFNILLHALCWVHAERLIHKLVGFNEPQRQAVEETRHQIWELYRDLKAWQKTPLTEYKAELASRFDKIFTTKTCFASLNHALRRLHQNKSELLLVLERPDIPLHNNLSENDIREYVKKRKISGSTRSGNGRRCRDTFASLKKTCRKLGVSFWQFLNDRFDSQPAIPPLSDLIRQRANETPLLNTG
jgi:hypothetical protein